MTEQNFSPEMITKLQHYVYLYLNPLNNQVFYIGKGQGNRVFEHLQDESDSAKGRTIREMRAQGMKPKLELLAHHLPDEESALRIESAAIDLIGLRSLTNVVRGYDSRARGRVDVNEILLQEDAGLSRRRGGRDFDAVLAAYQTIAPRGFEAISRSDPGIQRASTWAKIIPADWPSDWANIFYSFQVHIKYGNHIGVEIHDEREKTDPEKQRNRDDVTAALRGLESELKRCFTPDKVKWFDAFEYVGYGPAILFDRRPDWTEADATEVAQAMCVLIDKTYATLRASWRA